MFITYGANEYLGVLFDRKDLKYNRDEDGDSTEKKRQT